MSPGLAATCGEIISRTLLFPCDNSLLSTTTSFTLLQRSILPCHSLCILSIKRSRPTSFATYSKWRDIGRKLTQQFCPVFRVSTNFYSHISTPPSSHWSKCDPKNGSNSLEAILSSRSVHTPTSRHFQRSTASCCSPIILQRFF